MSSLNMLEPDAAVTAQLFNGLAPLIIQPISGQVSLMEWCASHKEYIEASLERHGALLFRGFELTTPQHFQQAVTQLGGTPLDYSERSSPRSEVVQGVYTSTDYPARRTIFPHNETSYAMTFPLRLFFFCETPPAKGGETPIADTRRVLARLSLATREKFIEKKWMLLRNLHEGGEPGYSWQSAFQSSDRTAVEDYCREQHIDFEWRPQDGLRVRHIRSAIEKHPRTGDAVWFNHAAFFHISTFDPAVSEALISVYGKENLPNNSFYGTGEEIEPEVLDEIRAAYRAELISFTWEKGDLLMIDNMLMAHSRAPYQPPRKILVAMTTPYRRPTT